MTRSMRSRGSHRLSIVLSVLAATATAQGGEPAPNDLTDLSLEELMQVEVEVGSRQDESWFGAASSIYVVTADQIRRSGLRALPEVLRLVPGMLIAEDVSGAYSFSSRLGEVQFAGMLVLVDGQRLFPTLLRREYWQVVDLPLENVERIEVVRGPGGARWGDRAAQGVINIVTRKADSVEGVRVSVGAGDEDRGSASFRATAALGEDWHGYVYGKMAQRDGGYPSQTGDRWSNNGIGLRLDGQPGEKVTLSLDAFYSDSYIGDSYLIDPGYDERNNIGAGWIKGRLRFDHGDGSSTELKAAYDAYDQCIDGFRAGVGLEYQLYFREQLYDLSLQHSMPLTETQRLNVGLGLRHLGVDWHDLVGDHNAYNDVRADLFASWQLQLGDDWHLTLGGNAGYVDGRRTQGVDFQPDLRLSWTPDADWTVWGAISANREPDTRVRDVGNSIIEVPSNRFVAYELGLRRRWGETALLQVDGFVYDIDAQLTDEQTNPGTGATDYVLAGETRAFGGELALSWQCTEALRLRPFYALTVANAHDFLPGSFTAEDEVPRNRAGATVEYNLAEHLELDSNLFYTERHGGIPTHLRWDLRLGWNPDDRTQISAVVQDILDDHHPENFYLEQKQRAFYLLVSHRF